MRPDRQLDLFTAGGAGANTEPARGASRQRIKTTELDSNTLIEAIPNAGRSDCRALAEEAARRRLVPAIPALEASCRRFKGFGGEHPVSEQTVSVQAIGEIGGHDAMAALTRILVDQVVQGPGLCAAIGVAARLRCRLPSGTVMALLRHAEPAVRADAARCARPSAEVTPVLLDLLGDLNLAVALAAAVALGNMGRVEAVPMLSRMLREQPSVEVIDAVSPVADEACIVQLGRITRTKADLAEAALAALEDIDDKRAAVIAAAIRADRSVAG